jgi:hypothetical protein
LKIDSSELISPALGSNIILRKSKFVESSSFSSQRCGYAEELATVPPWPRQGMRGFFQIALNRAATS